MWSEWEDDAKFDEDLLAIPVPMAAIDLAPSKWAFGHPAKYTNV
jgi:hypothetical protein